MRKKCLPASWRGFTLVEILVAMTIVAVLVSLALVSYQGARKSARDGKRKADLEQVRSALEMRRADCGSYPSGTISSGGSITGDGTNCAAVTYMVIPSDPLTGNNYVYTRLTASTYDLCALLEVGGVAESCGVTSCGSAVCNYKVTNP